MAAALRPVVALMLLATLLLVADGYLDGAYPGGRAWSSDAYLGLGWTPYAYAAVNLLAAVLVARGSERGLVGRIGLSGFFLVERPLSAVLLGPKSDLSILVHAATAAVELVILLGGLRVWRLGRSFDDSALAQLLDLDPAAAPAGAMTEEADRAPIGSRGALAVGLLAFTLAAILVADGTLAGYVPGGRAWGITRDTAGWVVYLLAVGLLTVAARGVSGGLLALRALFAVALALFVERAFSPFIIAPAASDLALLLHALAAFVALVLALAAAGAIRRRPVNATRIAHP